MNKNIKKSDATELRHRISFQAITASVPDGEGGFNSTWTDINNVWAKVSPLRAEKVAEFKSSNVHATHLIKVRGTVPVDELNRIRFGSRIFVDLVCENKDERSFEKFITCNEVRA